MLGVFQRQFSGVSCPTDESNVWGEEQGSFSMGPILGGNENKTNLPGPSKGCQMVAKGCQFNIP